MFKHSAKRKNSVRVTQTATAKAGGNALAINLANVSIKNKKKHW
ncbi:MULTISPECIES: hypothetical protein [unclassified Paenibacillus]|nr:hypothetical protein [Paenibacillus sp. AR247]